MKTSNIKLGDASTLITKGTTPTTVGYQFVDAGIPFFRAEDVNGGAISINTVDKRITPECHHALARSQLQTGDLLITIAGTVGRIGIVPAGVEAANCNQAVSIIRLKSDLFDLQFLCYFLRSSIVQRKFRQQGTTATITNVSLAQIRDIEVPLLPLSEQRRIVDILSRAEGIVRLRRDAEKKAAELIPALFLDMFGDPATNPRGWPTTPFGEIGTLDRGKSRHRPRDAAELYGGVYPFIQTGDVSNSGGRITQHTATYSELGLKQSRLWPRGTLCITIAANIAKTGVLDFDACFPDSVVGFLPSEHVRTEYIQSWLGFLQPTLEANAPQAAQKNINLEILRNLPVPVPPLELQDIFDQRCSAVFSIQTQQSAATATAQATFDALLAQMFG